MNIKPLKLLLIGALILMIGAFLKILKIEYSSIFLSIGLLFEISAGVIYFVNKSKNKAL